MAIFFTQDAASSSETSIKTDAAFGGLAYDDMTIQGIYRTGRRPVFENFRGDLYLGGSYTRVMVRPAADRRWLKAGIAPPSEKLSVVPGSGSGGSSGGCLAYITFLHKNGLRVLAESDPSNIVNVGDLTGQGRLWSSIQATGADLRVTHVRGYASMLGGPYRMAWESPYGLTTVEENVLSARLSLLGPGSGTGDFRNGLPPSNVHFIHPWAARMWYARNSEFPYRVWYSQPGQPQYVGPASFRDTMEREPITGLWRGRNELVVFCQDNSYMIRQFGTGVDDFVMERLDSNVGCLTHHGIREIHNRLWFPARDGVWIYDGGFRYVMEDMRLLWEREYCNWQSSFESGFAAFDKLNKVYVFYTPRPQDSPVEWEAKSGLSPKTVAYVGYLGNFEPSMGGQESQPDWTLDFKAREDSSTLYGKDNEMYVASCDGEIRRQIKACELDAYDPDSDTLTAFGSDDDGDTIQKEVIIRHGHMLMFQPGDDVQQGKKLLQLWFHIESEAVGWTAYAIGGDEDAWRSVRPTNVRRFWKYDSLLSRETKTLNGYDYVSCAKSVHFFLPEKVSGRGFTFETRASNVINFKYRGLGGMWGPGGVAFRPPFSETAVP